MIYSPGLQGIIGLCLVYALYTYCYEGFHLQIIGPLTDTKYCVILAHFHTMASEGGGLV